MHTKLHTQHFHDKCRGTVLQISLILFFQNSDFFLFVIFKKKTFLKGDLILIS